MNNNKIASELVKLARMLALPEHEIEGYINYEGEKWAILARSSGLYSGRSGEAYLKKGKDKIMLFDTEHEAQKYSDKLNKKEDSLTSSVQYFAVKYERMFNY